jgi:hypothetical protein
LVEATGFFAHRQLAHPKPHHAQKMDAVQTIAGAWLMDEILQTAAPLLHAGGLRTTYARQHRYKLNIADYARPQDGWRPLAAATRAQIHVSAGAH